MKICLQLLTAAMLILFYVTPTLLFAQQDGDTKVVAIVPGKANEIKHIAGILIEHNIILSEVLLREVYGNASREGDVLFSKNVDFAEKYKGIDIKIEFSDGVMLRGTITIDNSSTKYDGTKQSDFEWLAETVEAVKLNYGDYTVVDAGRAYKWNCENGFVSVVRQNDSEKDFSISVIYEISEKEDAEIVFIREKAKEYFRDIYVEANFKNPYSYELLKLEVTPVIASQSLAEELRISKLWAIKTDTTLENSQYQEMKRLLSRQERLYRRGRVKANDIEETKGLIQQFKAINEIWLRNIDFITNEIRTLDHEKETKIREYEILIHCQADNSYGGKVLGRYKFNLNPDGSLKAQVEEVNQFGFPINKPLYL